MSAANVRQCGTVCEAGYFDLSKHVAIMPGMGGIDDTDDDDRSPITDDQRRFAQRSQDHMTLAVIMGPISARRLVPVAVTLRHGLPGDHLPYPRDFVVKHLRKFSDEEQSEAWELFGKGVEP